LHQSPPSADEIPKIEKALSSGDREVIIESGNRLKVLFKRGARRAGELFPGAIQKVRLYNVIANLLQQVDVNAPVIDPQAWILNYVSKKIAAGIERSIKLIN